MTIDVVWPEPKPLDHYMLIDMFSGVDYKPLSGINYNIVDSFDQATGRGVVHIANGATSDVSELNEVLSRYEWVLLMIASDEENLFDIDNLEHPNIKVWVQTPRANKDYGDVRFFGVGYGYSSRYRSDYTQGYLNKPADVFISGQNTHARRNLVFEQLDLYEETHPENRVQIFETEGFTQGMDPADYYNHMAATKVAPAPSGIVSPDSFRLYEALEMGAVPIADDVSPRYDSRGYWARIFPDAPFPILQDDDINTLIDEAQDSYQEKANSIFAWWMAQKRRYAHDLVDDILELSGEKVEGTADDRITVVVPVSPWRSHPDTKVLDDCLRSVRAQLPTAEIIVTFDGVREEQKDKTDSYQEFIKRALWKINTDHKNVLPLVFDEHLHQSGMMKEALNHIITEYVLYMEGDMSFYEDRAVPWGDFVNLLDSGKANILRVHFEASIPEAHEYLMYHEHDLDIDGDRYVATSQWSQRPHLMSRDMYGAIMRDYFSEDARCFIEDRFYYIIHGECNDGNWGKWKMFIYLPKDGLNRAYHLDGRDGETKYDDKQIW